MKPEMNTGEHNLEQSKGQFLVYQREDGTLKLEVRLEDETVWLSQKLMAELFQKDVRTINHHIQSIYEEGELDPTPTIRKFRIVQMEGKREVTRMVDFYNLDILNHAGKISHEMAKHLAEGEYEKFHSKRLTSNVKELSDFDKAVKQIESTKKKENHE